MRKKIPLEEAKSSSTIFRRRKEAGLVKPLIKAEVVESFFDEWSDEMAWLLGLIWSDGCLYKNTVEISSKDLEIIELVSALAGGRIALKNRGRHMRVTLTSRYLANQLRSLRLTERKSLTIEFPPVPDEWTGAFVRGLIDGDGSVLLRSGRPGQQVADLMVQLVTASENLKRGLEGWFLSRGISFSLSARKSQPQYATLYKFSIVHQQSLIKLHSLLYFCEDTCCLHRKRVPFDEWMRQPRARSGRPSSTQHHATNARVTNSKKRAQAARERIKVAKAHGQTVMFEE